MVAAAETYAEIVPDRLPQVKWEEGQGLYLDSPVEPTFENNQECLQYYGQLVAANNGDRPVWGDIDPRRITRLLPYIYLLEIDRDRIDQLDGHYFRMFGTELVNISGMELYHKNLAQVTLTPRVERSFMIQQAVVGFDQACLMRGQFKGLKNDIMWAECLFLPLVPRRPNQALFFGTQNFRFCN